MAVGDPSREDAAADARPTVVAVRLRRGAALVDDHGVTLDAAFRVVVADVEGAVLGDASLRGTPRRTGAAATRARATMSFCMIILGLRRCDLSGGLV